MVEKHIPKKWKLVIDWGNEVEIIPDSEVSDVLLCAVWSFLTEPPIYCGRPTKYNGRNDE